MTKSEALAVAEPILFNTEMVRAILDGRKTQTRRVIKPQYAENSDGTRTPLNEIAGKFNLAALAPYLVGDILYVRETWLEADERDNADRFAYKADETNYSRFMREEFGYTWRPSTHMPKEAARIFLRVTEVRAERLQEITEDDARAEGAAPEPPFSIGHPGIRGFRHLWDSTVKHADINTYGWAANPWVWVYEFERVEVDG